MAPAGADGIIACMITLGSSICRSDSHLATEISGEIVLMSVDRGVYCGLNESGGEIWRRIERPIRVEDLCADLARDFDAPAATIAADVLALLARLLEQDLIEVRE
ncbi:MAG: PqqD family protein [Alphaproteobacteria bacterium]|nr:PqqD family protein [Alphaproteobacteria bacterium]